MRVLITGSRDWTDRRIIQAALRGAGMGERHTLVSGACPTGADLMAEEEAAFLGWDIERHPADWSIGKKAGPLRNQQMVDLGADLCLAFILNDSRGATRCANAAEAAGIPVVRHFRATW